MIPKQVQRGIAPIRSLEDLQIEERRDVVVVPPRQETFECQVLVFTQACRRPASFFSPDGTTGLFPPFEEIRRVIAGGHYRLDFVASSLVGGKPTLIIHEYERDNEDDEGKR